MVKIFVPYHRPTQWAQPAVAVAKSGHCLVAAWCVSKEVKFGFWKSLHARNFFGLAKKPLSSLAVLSLLGVPAEAARQLSEGCFGHYRSWLDLKALQVLCCFLRVIGPFWHCEVFFGFFRFFHRIVFPLWTFSVSRLCILLIDLLVKWLQLESLGWVKHVKMS